MTTTAWLTILAIVIGPIIAVQTQKLIEKSRETKNKKKWIFYTLMATRASRVAPEHVRALNSIDFEFKEESILEAWRLYLDHLNNQQVLEDQLSQWGNKCEDLFIDLLHSIAVVLKYKFDKVQLKRGIYIPRAQGEQELAILTIRDRIVKILSGDESIPIRLISSDPQ